MNLVPCPMCGGRVSPRARQCPHCGESLKAAGGGGRHSTAERMIVPFDTPPMAIIASYLGLLSVLPLFHLFALLVGILALAPYREDPTLAGKGRAIFAIVMGGLFTAIYGLVFGAVLLGG